MANDNIGTEIQAIIDFSNKLDKYTDDLLKGIYKLQNVHTAMGKYWKDRQYNEMTNVIDEFRVQVGKIKKELDIITHETREDARRLTKVHEIKINW